MMKVIVDPDGGNSPECVGLGGSWRNRSHRFRDSNRCVMFPSYHLSTTGLRLTLPCESTPMSSINSELSGILSDLSTDWQFTSSVWADYHDDMRDPDTAKIIRLTRDMLNDTSSADDATRQRREKLLREMNAAGIHIPLPILSYQINNVDFHYRLIPPGFFWLGPANARKLILLTKPYWMSLTHITQAQWKAVTGDNPSYFDGVDHGDLYDATASLQRPVEQVNWHQCGAFAVMLSEKTGITHKLPSEAEWEHACRACTTSLYHFGDSEKELARHAWYSTNSKSQTHPVGMLLPNSWGLYDIVGNVWAWTRDSYESDYWERMRREAKDVVVDPGNSSGGSRKTNRGGGRGSLSRKCQSGNHGSIHQSALPISQGVRLVITDPTSTTNDTDKSVRGGCWDFGSYNTTSEIRNFATSDVPVGSESDYSRNRLVIPGTQSIVDPENQNPERSLRVGRGGCWSYREESCRAAFFGNLSPTYSNSVVGFRLTLPGLSPC